jgi:hypothetical protein
MSTSDDFMEKLLQGKKSYQEEQKGSTKRRRFAPGLIVKGRLLPYDHQGSMRFLETFYHHYFESIRGDGWSFLACPKNGNDWEAACDFCDAMVTHYKEHGSDAIYNAYKRKRKYKVNFYCTGIDTLPDFTVSDSDMGLWREVVGQVIVLDLPFTVKEKIDIALNDEDIGLDIFNPLSGYDIRIKVSLKKTDDGEFPNYDLTDFSRKKTALDGELSSILSDCTNLSEQIQLLKEADSNRIHDAAIAEGLVASAVGSSQEESLPTNDSSSVPSSTSASANDESEQKTEESEGGSLQDIFNKYRKN